MFSPGAACNLKCGHCDIRPSAETLSVPCACKFLKECRRLGVSKVGFTGGEPFLKLGFLCSVTEAAVKNGFLFDRIMTNAVWWPDENLLKVSLIKLFNAGYDGSICVSVDAFHRQDIHKVARFIVLASRIWNRPDLISIAYVFGAKDGQTASKLSALQAAVKTSGARVFLRCVRIRLSPVGRAASLTGAWSDEWFKEDHCRGPGNVFFVLPDGGVKPCCGYATDNDELTIGNINKDSAKDIMKKVRGNVFVRAVFKDGLSRIRSRLEKAGQRFPGKTADHCFFCDYILNNVPRKILMKCLTITLFAMLLLPRVLHADDLVSGKDCKEIPVTVVNKLSIPKGYHEGLFYDGKCFWLANGENGDVWAIDPASGVVTSSLRAVSDFVEAFIKTDNGQMFTTEWNTKRLYRVSIADNALSPDKEISFEPAHPAGLICANGRIFTVTWTRGMGTKFRLIELDKDLNIIKDMLIKDIQEPDQLAWDGKNLWISSWYSKLVYRVDIDRWEMTGYFRSPVSKTTGIAWDGKYMWLTGTYSDLYKIEIGK